MKKIYYYFAEEGFGSQDEIFSPERSVLADDRFYFPPEPAILSSDKKFSYYECPAWSHKAKRTFTIRSPIDFKFTFDLSQLETNGKVFIDSPLLSEKSYQQLTYPTFEQPNWFLTNPNRIVMQLTAPRLICWTNEKNIWMEQRPHPKTSAKNNFVLVGGWFNISAWTRFLSFAFDVYDLNRPVIIKRGDPLYEICFYSNNINDKFKLINKEPPDDLKLKIHRNVLLKSLNPFLSKKFMFGQEEKESKCPFSFLWKN
jgi:hypothetical protein